MAKRQPKQLAIPTTEREGQLSAMGGIQNFFIRNVPLWNPPAWQEADWWRMFVEKQGIAAICRDTIANYLNSLDWAIVARDSEKRDELKPRIKHYTKLFERGNAYYWDLDFSSQVEFFVKDLFTLPFGTASEIGRLDDSPTGKVVWIRPIDGGTLAPTLNFDYPIVQSAPGTDLFPVFFPREFVSRVYLSPRTELRREGWGYAPPERIWRSIEMLSTGDNYYAKLLLDTPEAGMIDLGDMEKTTALQWIKSLEDLLYGINPLKIPVLYEHTTAAKYIPFGRPPSELMYDSVTMKYAAILAAGYGLTLSDIGFPSSSGGGDTLAGTIRMERVGKSSGKALAKKKWESYSNRILDPALKWQWIDYDDERNVSKGRARLASAQAADIWVRNKVFTPGEIRQQNLADGLISIDVPETVDPNSPEFPLPPSPFGAPAGGGSRGRSLGNPVNPSQGGQGEVIPQQIVQRSARDASVGIAKAVCHSNEVLATLIETVKGNLAPEEIGIWEEYVDGYLVGKSDIEEPKLKNVLDDICNRAKTIISEQSWVRDIERAIFNEVIGAELRVQSDKTLYRLSQKAEEDFISGKSDDLVPSGEELTIDLSKYDEGLHGVIFDSLASEIARHAVLVSKSYLISGKLEVDSTEKISKNISVSREIAEEVLQSFSRVVRRVYEYASQYLEQEIERTEQNAVN